jgi:putative methionine-R-sulfoxide reductase with GAF domain
MRFSKPLIITLCIFLALLAIASVVLFYRLAVIQSALKIGLSISDFNGIIQTNFRIVFILASVIIGIGIISLIAFILNELSRKLTIFSHRRQSFDYASNGFNENGKNKKNIDEKDKQTQLNQVKTENFKIKIEAVINNNESINQTAKKILIEFAELFQIVQGEIYLIIDNKIKLFETYAYYVPEGKITEFEIGDGLIGQVAKEKKALCLDNIPDNYITVATGLGKATPSNLIIFPLIYEKELVGIIELASFNKYSRHDEALCMNLSEILGKYFNQNTNKQQ